MNPRERELLTGMGNCYEACHASFPETVSMVADARGLTPAFVREELVRFRKEFAGGEEYERLRSRFPAEFPV